MIPVFVVVARSLSTVVCIDANPAENKSLALSYTLALLISRSACSVCRLGFVAKSTNTF
jgi:hypothetical protein